MTDLRIEDVLAEKAALQTEIERLRGLNDEQQAEIVPLQMALIKATAEIARLKAERHTVKQMLQDILDRHGQHYGVGRGGLK